MWVVRCLTEGNYVWVPVGQGGSTEETPPTFCPHDPEHELDPRFTPYKT